MFRRIILAAVLAGTVFIGVRAATALFHLAVIDEVMTSYGGDANVQFVEVRMLAGSQNFVAHSVFAAFDTNANYLGDLLVVPSNVTNSGAGVRWIIGTTDFETASGLTANFTFSPGLLPTAGGMVCFGGGGGLAPQNPPTWDRTNFANYVDCVAYGTYVGTTNATLTALIGNSTPLDPDGHSLERVSTTNDNATDFACADPATPENNAGATASLVATTPCSVASAGCPATVDGTCTIGFGKGLLQVKENGDKSKLLAKLSKGPALMQTDFGNPLSPGGTIYDVCIYGPGGTLVHAADAYQVDRAGDSNCDGKDCWSAIGSDPPLGKGYKFKDKAGTSNGIGKALLKGGDAGKSSALVKGKGNNLPTGVAGALSGATSATLQLRASDGDCLSVNLTDVKKNDPTFFKAK